MSKSKSGGLRKLQKEAKSEAEDILSKGFIEPPMEGIDPYHDGVGSIMQTPSMVNVEKNRLEANLNEISTLIDVLSEKLKPILGKTEVVGKHPREINKLPDLVKDFVKMDNIATEIKDKLIDLNVNIVL